VLVSILYRVTPVRPSQPGGPAPVGIYGSTVVVFNPDLTSSRELNVYFVEAASPIAACAAANRATGTRKGLHET